MANEIEEEVLGALALQRELQDTEASLMQNETFRQFLELQKTVPKQIQEIWDTVEQRMIEQDVKSIKGDWGSITIAERIGWDIDTDALPNKFIKKVPDTKKITDTFRLEGKAPKGASPKYSKFLTKRIK